MEVGPRKIMAPDVCHWTDKISPYLTSSLPPAKAERDVLRNRRTGCILELIEKTPTTSSP
jgi:hypothetical protein